MIRLAAISRRCLITDRTRSPVVGPCWTASWGAGPRIASGAASAAGVWRSVTVEHPILGGEEVDGGEGADDHHEQPGHRRGVAHLELPEPALVQVQRVEQ